MPRGDLLGSLEHVVLLALVHLGPNAYGMTVRREIEERTGRELSIGAVYATLERLEKKDTSARVWASRRPSAERVRLYRLEAEGRRALRSTNEIMRKMSAGLESRWGIRVTRSVSPRLATWLVGCLLSATERDALIGDLVEECTLRFDTDSGADVSWWYWSQISRSLPALFWAALLRFRWLGAAGAAIVGYGVFKVLERAGGAAASRLLAPGSASAILVGVVIGLAGLALGGHVAAPMRLGAALPFLRVSTYSVLKTVLSLPPLTAGHLPGTDIELPEEG